MITLYPAETQNFAGNGLMELSRYCTRCDLMEELNGAYTADIEFAPFPDMHKLHEDMILRIPANVRETPYMEIAGVPPTPDRTIYKVNVTTSKERSFTYIYSKPRWRYELALKRLHKDTEYEYLGEVSEYFHRAVTADGTTGYILNGDGEFLRTEGGEGALAQIVASRQTRDQLFRIKRVTPGTNGIVVFARHISGDLQKDNYVPEIKADNATGAQLAQAILDSCVQEHAFNLFSNVDKVYTGTIGRTSPMNALIGADTGLTSLIGGEILRDNFDIYYAKAIGRDRGATIEWGKNAVKMDITIDEEDVCTRVIPIGYDKDNNRVQLPELYADSPRADAWDRPRGICELDLRDVKIGDTYKDLDALYAAMREKAAEYFETGVDRPKISATAEYVDLSRTNAAGRGPVSVVFLGDTVLLRDPRHKLAYRVKVTSYVFDALTKTYRSLSFGEPQLSLHNIRWTAKNLAGGSVSAVKLASQTVTGPVIAPGAVSGGNIAEGTILARNIAADTITGDKIAAGQIAAGHLQADAVTAEKIAADAVSAKQLTAGAVTAEKLAAGSVTAEKLATGAVSADNITSGKLDTDRLIVGGTEFSIVRALNQLANSLSENDDSIDGNVLSDKSISAVKVTDDFGAGLELSSNAAVLLLAGKLDGTHSHMELTESAINMVGGDINIATDDLDVRGMQNGEEIMSLSPDGLSAGRVVVRREFSAPNAVLKNLSGSIPWKGSIQASLDAAPKWLTEGVYLYVPSGTYQEDVVIRGFKGAQLTVAFLENVVLNGTVTVEYCDHVVLMSSSAVRARIFPAGPHTTITARSVDLLEIAYLMISGYRQRTTQSNGTQVAVRVNGGSCRISGCCIEYSEYGVYFANGATGVVSGNTGGCAGSDPTTNANLGTGIQSAEGSHICVLGTAPMGVYGATGTWLGTMLTENVTPTPGGMEYVPPTEVTKTFPISKHCTYFWGVQRMRDDMSTLLSQGHYGGYTTDKLNWRTGAMWFAAATAELAGREIISATLRLRRAGGGVQSAVPVYLGYTALTESQYLSTLTPPFEPSASNYPGAGILREEEGAYDVTQLMAAVQAGYAIAVREPTNNYGSGASNFSDAYTYFYGKGSNFEPVLTVTYKESAGGGGGGGSLDVTDDGKGHVTIQLSGLDISDDGAGHATIQLYGLDVSDDGAGHVTIA